MPSQRPGNRDGERSPVLTGKLLRRCFFPSHAARGVIGGSPEPDSFIRALSREPVNFSANFHMGLEHALTELSVKMFRQRLYIDPKMGGSYNPSRPGARKPVPTEARKSNVLSGCQRIDSFGLVVEPTSL